MIHSSSTMADLIADAVAARLAKPEDLRTHLTFGYLFERWLNDYAKPHMVPYTVWTYDRAFQNHFARWKDVRVCDIKRGDVQGWLTGIAEANGPGAGNRARDLMRMVFNRCIEWDLIPNDYNPAQKLRKFKIRPRSRFLQSDEMPRFFAALDTLRYQTTKDFLLMCLLTAVRRSNVAAMRWDEVDLDFATWKVPRTKNGDEQIVPLTEMALSILNRRKLHADSPWVFPSDRSSTGHLTKPEKAWGELVKRAQLENVRMHDLRRSLASWQAITGANLVVIAKTLGHRDLNSTAIYARLNVADQRRAMRVATEAMLRAAGKESR